jgi:hypothetical protein
MTLKEILNVPNNHEIVQTSYRGKGTMAQNEYWEYDELNENGEKVGRIEYWHCTNLKSLTSDSGYKKYNTSGQLVKEKSLS